MVVQSAEYVDVFFFVEFRPEAWKLANICISEHMECQKYRLEMCVVEYSHYPPVRLKKKIKKLNGQLH